MRWLLVSATSRASSRADNPIAPTALRPRRVTDVRDASAGLWLDDLEAIVVGVATTSSLSATQRPARAATGPRHATVAVAEVEEPRATSVSTRCPVRSRRAPPRTRSPRRRASGRGARARSAGEQGVVAGPSRMSSPPAPARSASSASSKPPNRSRSSRTAGESPPSRWRDRRPAAPRGPGRAKVKVRGGPWYQAPLAYSAGSGHAGAAPPCSRRNTEWPSGLRRRSHRPDARGPGARRTPPTSLPRARRRRSALRVRTPCRARRRRPPTVALGDDPGREAEGIATVVRGRTSEVGRRTQDASLPVALGNGPIASAIPSTGNSPIARRRVCPRRRPLRRSATRGSRRPSRRGTDGR